MKDFAKQAHGIISDDTRAVCMGVPNLWELAPPSGCHQKPCHYSRILLANPLLSPDPLATYVITLPENLKCVPHPLLYLFIY